MFRLSISSKYSIEYFRNYLSPVYSHTTVSTDDTRWCEKIVDERVQRKMGLLVHATEKYLVMHTIIKHKVF